MTARRASALAAAALAVAHAPVAEAAGLDSAVGAYRFADGSAAALVEQAGALRLVDYGSGILRQLERRSRNVLVGGPGVSVTHPARVRVVLVADARGETVALRYGGRTATRLPLVSEQASFQNAGVRLVGRLLHPPGKGPFRAVLIVPGSVPATRHTYDLWAMFYATQGFAVLTYDKRGIGESGGRYVRAATGDNLRRLAADAIAGVDWLRRRSDVSRSQIGLSGGSQAGWVIELAAARSHAVRFAALQSGPAMSVGRQLAYSALTRQGAIAPTDDEIRTALDGVPDSGFDPKPLLAALRIPVLWQLGSVDRRMHTPETVADLASVDGGRHVSVRVYPGGAHSLRLTEHGTIAEEQASPGFVSRVFADLAAWLRTHVGSAHG
jgi:dienelactone hydrolase